MMATTPVNSFKQALKEGRPQIGLWLGLGDSYAAEICATAGFDWVLIDNEHSPNDLRSTLQAAQAVAAYPQTHAIARVPMGHGHVGRMLVKQYLDIGLQTLLVPMVDTAEQARELVRNMRYPPLGVRGIGGARASRWASYADYAQRANDEVCLIVQIESREALDNLEEIAAVDGVDALFIGPSDLAASLGYVGNNTHPDVQKVVDETIRRIVKCGKAPGILTLDDTLIRHQLDIGALFVAVGIDHTVLARGTRQLAAQYKDLGKK
jgi:4-hydroxy-2-oxoheptanedioate aldolase